MKNDLAIKLHEIVHSGMKTPFYYYDTSLLERTLHAARASCDQYGFVLHYALKANSNESLLPIIRKWIDGADCVSGNEVQFAFNNGFPSEGIVFAGVGKQDDEINLALNLDIACFNCESAEEIEVIQQHAARLGRKARIALRINPGVDAKTHQYITTGLEENKFGINLWELESILDLVNSCDHIELKGLHFHIGSQITSLQPFKSLCLRMNEVSTWFENRNIRLEHLNAGGGLGINYQHPDEEPVPDFNAFFNLFHRFLRLRPGQKLHFELGRSLIGQCGSLISKVLYVKKGQHTNFVILDAGMTELIRPALYQSFHKIENISGCLTNLIPYDVVGPICESSDCFGKAVFLPETKRGDIIAIRSAGAYGEVMASRYNLRNLVGSVI